MGVFRLGIATEGRTRAALAGAATPSGEGATAISDSGCAGFRSTVRSPMGMAGGGSGRGRPPRARQRARVNGIAGAASARLGQGSVRVLAASLLLAFAALLAAPQDARAQATYVSNLTTSSVNSLQFSMTLRAQTFTTGSNAPGYSLGSVELAVAGVTGTFTLSAAIYSTNNSGLPNSQLHSLTAPGTISADSVLSFTAPANTTLAANTTYAVVFERTGTGTIAFKRTASDNENTAATGWSIGDVYHNRGIMNTWPATTSDRSMLIAVKSPTTNTAATGSPTIAGVPQVGEALRAGVSGISDIDGGVPGAGAFTYQWIRVDSDGSSNPVDVGTNSSTYRPVAADIGKRIKVEVSFTDNNGNAEGPLASDAYPAQGYPAPAVGPARTSCPTDSDWCTVLTVGMAELPGLLDYYGYGTGFGGYGSLGKTTIAHGISSFRVTAISILDTVDDSLAFTLDAYLPRGTVIHMGGTRFIADADSEHSTEVQYSWSIPSGFAWSEGQKVTVSANLPPLPASARVVGSSLSLSYSELLDESSIPARTAYTVKVDGGAGVRPTDVSVSGHIVTLTLPSAVASGQTVTVSYAVPPSNPLRVAAGTLAASLTDEAATVRAAASTQRPSNCGTYYHICTTVVSANWWTELGTRVRGYDEASGHGSIGTTTFSYIDRDTPNLDTTVNTIRRLVEKGEYIYLVLDKFLPNGSLIYLNDDLLLRDWGGHTRVAGTSGTHRWKNRYPGESGPIVTVSGRKTMTIVVNWPRRNRSPLLEARMTIGETGVVLGSAGSGVERGGSQVSPRGFRYLLPRERTESSISLPVEYVVTELVANHAVVRLGVGQANPSLEAMVGDLVLEWAGETLPLSEGQVLGGAGAIEWDQAWLNANASSLNAANYQSTLPVGRSVGLCLRAPGQTCPSSTAVASAPQFAADAFREVPVMGSGTETAPRPIGKPLTATDTRRGTLVYRLSGPDGGKFTIDGNGQMWTKAGEYYDPATTGDIARLNVTVTIRNTEGLTASFEDVPASHDGSSAFTLRLAFSEAIVTSFRVLRDEAFTVTGGTVVEAKRVDSRSDLWNIHIEPDGTDAVTVTLPATTGACNATGAICAAGSLKLSGVVEAEVAGPPVTPVTPLTASLSEAPTEHDGSSAFTLKLTFSEAPDGLGFRTVRDGLFTVSGGEVVRAKRTEQGSDLGFRLTVEPSGNAAVTLSLATPLPACGQSGAVCTEDGRSLTGPVTATVQGPPGLSVADAEVHEGANAALAFAVSLSRAASGTVTVGYATSNVTATAGDDYTATSGTLTFSAGETSKTVSVPVLDDAHDDDGETLTLTLTLSNPSGAWLSDATATGTIRNTDAMPQAWLGRFGRTVADQVLDAVEGRMTAKRAPGMEASLAGQTMGFGSGTGTGSGGALGTGSGGTLGTGSGGTLSRDQEAREAAATLEVLADVFRGEDGDGKEAAAFGSREVTGRELTGRELTGRELLSGTSFSLTGGTGQAGFGALWGRGAVTRFDGDAGELALDGEVASALVGADFTRGRGTAGVVVSHSLGEGGYRSPSGDGEVESALTGLYPWGRYAVSERLTVWGVGGYGTGTLRLTPAGQSAMETDMALSMGAVGGRGVLMQPPAEGGLQLSVKSDALVVRTTSDAVGEGAMMSLAASEADVTRLRLGLEGTWRGLGTGGGGSFEPTFEVGMRHDGGDAETGFGIDVGAALGWTDASRGIRAQVSARGLLTHADDGFAERGFAGTLAWDPSPESGLGPSLTLSQTVGASAAGGMDALLGPQTAQGLGTGNDAGDELARRRMEARLGYGIALFGGGWTGTPELGLGWSESERETVLGWRLAQARSAGLVFGLDVEGARRKAFTRDAAPEHRLGVGFGWRLAGRGQERFEVRMEGARALSANGDREPEDRIGVKLTARW